MFWSNCLLKHHYLKLQDFVRNIFDPCHLFLEYVNLVFYVHKVLLLDLIYIKMNRILKHAALIEVLLELHLSALKQA